jgi:hypothetical protein
MLSNIINKLFKNKNGIIVVSIILGLGLASIFKKTCVGDGCIIIKSLPPDEVQANTYRHDDKCYKYKAHSSKCTDNDVSVE